MRIALTGGQGFTGSHFAQHARRAGHEVAFLRSDLTDAEALAAEVAGLEADAVLHLAAIAYVAYQDPRKFYDVNLFGTLNLLDSLIKSGREFRSVLLASSANVYGNWDQGAITEEVPPCPVNHYAMSKLAMEHMSRTYQSRLPIITVRPFNYTGPGQARHFVVPKLVDHFRRREVSVRLGNLNVQREYNDVRFVCDAYLRLLELAPAGATYNVCTGHTHDLLGMIAVLERITGHRMQIEKDPDLVRANEVTCLRGDPARLLEAVGALPQFSIEDTLKWMLSSDS